MQFFKIKPPEFALHQIGRRAVTGLARQQAQNDTPRTRVQGGCGRQNGRATHAHALCGHALTANHRHIAMAAFVAGVGFGCRCVKGIEPGLRRHAVLAGAIAQVIEPNLATGVASMPHEQPGLHRDEAQGVVGLHSQVAAAVAAVATQPLARLRVEPGRHVDGQHGGQAVVHGLHAGQQISAQGACGSDAQQGVDAQILRIHLLQPLGGHAGLNAYARLLRSLQGRLGISRDG